MSFFLATLKGFGRVFGGTWAPAMGWWPLATKGALQTSCTKKNLFFLSLKKPFLNSKNVFFTLPIIFCPHNFYWPPKTFCLTPKTLFYYCTIPNIICYYITLNLDHPLTKRLMYDSSKSDILTDRQIDKLTDRHMLLPFI